MKAEVTLYPVELHDIDTLLLIEEASHLTPWTRDNFSSSIVANYPAWYIRNDEGEPCAYCVLMPAVDELHILNMTVAFGYRRCGYGRYLLDVAQNLARERTIPRLLLEVRISNAAAIGCYTAYGFKEIGRRRAYYAAPDGAREDALVMAYALRL